MADSHDAKTWVVFSYDSVDTADWRRWDELNESFCEATPVLSSTFVRALFSSFAPDRAFFAAYPSRDRPDICLIVHRSGLLDWTVACPGQASLGLVVASPSVIAEKGAKLLADLMHALPGLVVRLAIPKQDPAAGQLAGLSDPAVESRDHGITTAVQVDGDFDVFWGDRHKEVRRTMRRAMSALDSAGIQPGLRCLTDHDEMAGAVAAHGVLESSGWKGKEGTAISASNRQGTMYTELLEAFAKRGEAAAYHLEFDADVVASLLTVRSGPIHAVLKTAYDERYAEFAPGRMIDYFMFRYLFEHCPGHRIENYTVSSATDRRWSTSQRSIVDLDLIPSSMLRGVREARRRWLS